MKFKLDGNLGRRGLELMRAAGHDVTTVRDQGLSGATDEALFSVCVREERALVALDHDFGHVLRFPLSLVQVLRSWNPARRPRRKVY